MDLSQESRNDFLLKLLALQQDGKGAISAPSNWATQKPLLKVNTEIDKYVDKLQGAILQRNGENRTARWHFFIGSPGNGKSAAMGKLCEGVQLEHDCRVFDENGVSIDGLDETTVPYEIQVFEKGNKYASAYIVQDASVVRNPFSPHVDPAIDLLETLENAWKKGISLIVCANRGVLEKAHRDRHTDPTINSKTWFRVLTQIVQEQNSKDGEIQFKEAPKFESKRPVFEDVSVTYNHMDNRSLLLGSSAFDDLLLEASNKDRWSVCETCSVKQKCPFKSNRDWIANPELRKSVIQLMQRAEIYSGQVIVFREALALISLILSGCPSDYLNLHHPCEWVKDKVMRDDVFSLAVRRIYMCFFGSFCPHGLEENKLLRKKQTSGICKLLDAINGGQVNETKSVSRVIDCYPPSRNIVESPPSIDVGVTRLLGPKGVFSEIDPTKESLKQEFYERWDSDFDSFLKGELVGFGAIEEDCVRVWKALEEEIEFTSGYWGAEAHWALRRWSSNFLLHLGAMVEKQTAWAEELDELAEVLNLVNQDPKKLKIAEKLRIRELDNELEKLLYSVAGNAADGSVKLSDNVILEGRWVRDNIKPKTDVNHESGSVSLAIKFMENERTVMSAPMYLWLKRRANNKIDLRCIPLELLIGATDARVRAATKSRYAFVNDEVELIVETSGEGSFKLMRFGEGEVYVDYDEHK